MVSAKNILNPDLGPIGSLDSLVIKQIPQLSNPYSGVFSISRPTVSFHEIDFTEKCTYQVFQFRLKPNPSLSPKVRLISMMFKMAWIPQGFIAQTIIGIYLIW